MTQPPPTQEQINKLYEELHDYMSQIKQRAEENNKIFGVIQFHRHNAPLANTLEMYDTLLQRGIISSTERYELERQYKESYIPESMVTRIASEMGIKDYYVEAEQSGIQKQFENAQKYPDMLETYTHIPITWGNARDAGMTIKPGDPDISLRGSLENSVTRQNSINQTLASAERNYVGLWGHSHLAPLQGLNEMEQRRFGIQENLDNIVYKHSDGPLADQEVAFIKMGYYTDAEMRVFENASNYGFSPEMASFYDLRAKREQYERNPSNAFQAEVPGFAGNMKLAEMDQMVAIAAMNYEKNHNTGIEQSEKIYLTTVEAILTESNAPLDKKVLQELEDVVNVLAENGRQIDSEELHKELSELANQLNSTGSAAAGKKIQSLIP